MRKDFLLIFILLSLSVCTDNSIANNATNADLNEFKHSWTARALRLQREIDLYAPLNEATFIGTHNSYNAKSYEIPLKRYNDPNQILSIYDQLEMGIRSIELDAHWTLSDKSEKDILLCHAQNNHTGCGVFDRKFTEGLKELHDWLKANPDEIVLIYIERHVDGHEPRLAYELNQYLGDFIFSPALIRKLNKHQHTCVAIPTTLTKSAILKAKKQAIIVTKNCDGENPSYQEQSKYPLAWNDVAFAGIGSMLNKPFTFIDSTITDFNGYPDCGQSTIFKDDSNHVSMWRIYDDQSKLSSLKRPEKKISTDDMHMLMNCGINWPTLDMLTISDPRLTASIWSWALDYPKETQNRCAIYKYGEGIQNISCTQFTAGYACWEEQSHDMKAIPISGPQNNGESNCQILIGKKWHFATPTNGKQAMLLANSMRAALLSEIWINYTATADNHWMANNFNNEVVVQK